MMKKKIISLVEDDADGVTVVLAAPNQEMMSKDSTALWEAFCNHPNRSYPPPDEPSGRESNNDEGEMDCSFTASQPMDIAKEIVEDWLAEYAQVSEKAPEDDVYWYW
jgi:hypothetical protein